MSYDDQFEDDEEEFDYLTDEEYEDHVYEAAQQLLSEKMAELDAEDEERDGAFWSEIEAVEQRVGHPITNSDLDRIESWYESNPDTQADYLHAYNESKPDLNSDNERVGAMAELIEDYGGGEAESEGAEAEAQE